MQHREVTGHKPNGESRRDVLVTASLICSLLMLDSNIVAVSLPTIARSLDATFSARASPAAIPDGRC